MKMEIETLKRQTIERLKRVKKEQELSYSNIMDMLSSKGYYLSEPTLKKIFSENSDTYNFKYRDTIAPLADVLLDLYGDATNVDSSEEVKHLIREKNKMIEILLYKNEEQKADYERRINHLKKQVERLESNLDFREKMIDRKDSVIEELLSRISHKDDIIEKILTDNKE
jgi:hypothetical protein